jgi:hypothetical protein
MFPYILTPITERSLDRLCDYASCKLNKTAKHKVPALFWPGMKLDFGIVNSSLNCVLSTGNLKRVIGADGDNIKMHHNEIKY